MKISQCMIVKNEEQNIRKALSWGKDVVWEQIVVDTGSTDRTVELAEEMGAKVYHFKWIDDFSAAKNFALSKASGDWVAFLDADEYLTEEWAGRLIPFLENLEEGCYAVRSPLVSLNDAGDIFSVARHCRFFRHLPRMVYENAIHEVLTFEGEMLPDARIAETGEQFPVYHTGYTDAAMKEKNKRERNIALLEKELKKRPYDYNIMGYLGDSHNIDDKASKKKAEKWYRKAISLLPKKIHMQDERSALTFIYLLIILGNRGDEKEFLKIYEKVKTRMPWVYDADYMAGRFYIGKENYEKALMHFEKALQVSEKYGESAYGLYLRANIEEFWEHMAVCYLETNNLTSCVQYCVTLLKTDNRRIRALAVLLTALKGEKPKDVLKFLGNIYDLQEASDRIFLLRGASKAKAEGVMENLRQVCSPEEQIYLDDALKRIRELQAE